MSDNQSNISWHSKSAKDVMQELESSEEGLSDSEAKERLTYYGTNELRKRKKKNIGRMLLEQITDVMVLILIAGTKKNRGYFPFGII